MNLCIIAIKINGVYMPISKLHSILLTHNNISPICYCCQISLQSTAVKCSFCDSLTPLGERFILLAMVYFGVIFGAYSLLSMVKYMY